MRKKRENVQDPASYEQMREVISAVAKSVPQLSRVDAMFWTGRQHQLATRIRAIFTAVDPYRDALGTWERFYRDHFGMTVDLSGLRVP
ncbi:MAG: hypothetical protein IT406_02100, partial [Candidatus Yanofskybacteria bacterium]|nr:hypothetical protein [Candidatus Yanofskybacteria bacterium]